MTVDQSSELLRLRAMARDLLALSSIPQAWVGREALAIAGGLADVLIDSLDLDFVFVRLRDATGGDATEVKRSHSVEPFPDWLSTKIGGIRHLSRTEILSEGDGAEPYFGVAIPIGVNAEGGMVVAASRRPDFPNETDRLLLPVAANHAATAFQNAGLRKELSAKVTELGHTHDDLEVRVAERTAELNVANAELSALRRVATLVAQGSSRSEVFSAIAQEIAALLGFKEIRLMRYDDDSAVVVGAWGPAVDVFPIGADVQLADDSATSRVFHTGQPVRIDDYAGLKGPVADSARSAGVHSVVGWPISVGGRLWGALTAGAIAEELPPPEIDSHLGQFTELMATAIANAEARDEVERLAADQSALRRVATLVAETAPSAEIFSAVSNEVATLFRTEMVVVGKFDGDPVSLLVVGVGDRTDEPVVGSRWKLDDALASTAVYRTGRPARFAHLSTIADPDVAGLVGRFRPTATVAVPVRGEGRLWGAMIVSTRDGLLPTDTEERLQRFTDLIATALANAEARAEVERLAEEQAALRRVATLVAGRTSAHEVFAAVADEVQQLLGAEASAIVRFEDDGTVVTVGTHGGPYGPGTRTELDPKFVVAAVRQTRRAARLDTDDPAAADMPAIMRDWDIRSAVASPVVVDGKPWGAIVVASRRSLPRETEARLGEFTELVATAIANAESSAELAASRRRIVTASDEARRRIERDLHDGVQQRLVSLGLELGMMNADPTTGEALKEQLASVTADVRSVLDALVETARGIHPAILSQGGLAAALGTLARRSGVPVELHAQIVGPLPDDVEVAAYYVAAEALTNAAKHARASVVHMTVTTDGETLTLLVRDDGVGGADPGRGSGLVGLHDRVEALGGTIKIDSSAGSGTSVVVILPIAQESDQQIENHPGRPEELGSPATPA